MEGEGQPPLGGGGESNIPKINQLEGQTRVTAETVRQKAQERELAYSKLMDEMEDSVGEKGQYFIKYGDKNKGPNSNKDTRALLLIDPVVDKKDQKTLFVVVTREGGFGIGFGGEGSGKVDGEDRWLERMKSIKKQELDRLLPEEQREWQHDDARVAPSEYGFGFGNYGRVEINSLAGDPSPSLVFSPGEELRDVDFETVKDAITKSQKAAEIPHYLKLQQVQQRIVDAKALSDVIKQLPPKQ